MTTKHAFIGISTTTEKSRNYVYKEVDKEVDKEADREVDLDIVRDDENYVDKKIGKKFEAEIGIDMIWVKHVCICKGSK